MKRLKKSIVIILLFICLTACTVKNKTYNVTITINDNIEKVEVNRNTNPLDLLIEPEIEGYEFSGWYLDKNYEIPLPESYKINQNINIYAKLVKTSYTLTFIVNDEEYKKINVEHGNILKDVPTIKQDGYEFLGWSTRKNNGLIYDFNNPIVKANTFYAQLKIITFKVNYILNFDVFPTKNSLYEAYYTDFYNFLLKETDCDFTKYNISSLDDFLKFCKTWRADGRNEMGGLGDAFGKYYLNVEIGGKLENQPTTHFIGYCYNQGKYIDFIKHLMVFFAYWRTDEGYTGGQNDPNNLGNDFFASAWASFVDTCKFFYFTGDTLNNTYSWFKSERVKYALDHIPSVFEGSFRTTGDINNPIYLDNITREGYEFLGWFDEEGNIVTVITKSMTIYAKWKQL